MPRKSDFLIAPLGEGALILALSAVGYFSRQPFIFASLGPTAYELVEKPEEKSARAYNVVAGHIVGLGAAHLSLWLMHAYSAPKVMQAGFVSAPRMWAMVMAAVITTLVTLAIAASQPASLSTTLLVAIGSMQTQKDAIIIVLAVVLIAILGEPIRHARLLRRREQ